MGTAGHVGWMDRPLNLWAAGSSDVPGPCKSTHHLCQMRELTYYQVYSYVATCVRKDPPGLHCTQNIGLSGPSQMKWQQQAGILVRKKAIDANEKEHPPLLVQQGDHNRDNCPACLLPSPLPQLIPLTKNILKSLLPSLFLSSLFTVPGRYCKRSTSNMENIIRSPKMVSRISELSSNLGVKRSLKIAIWRWCWAVNYQWGHCRWHRQATKMREKKRLWSIVQCFEYIGMCS